MNPDAFAFFNEQLAAMLRQGLPLEGALRQLAKDMARGRLRTEIGRLEADLAPGTPLEEPLQARQFPPLYTRLLVVGRQGGNLPAALTLAADHYHQAAHLWLRLKGLMVYPLLVLGVGFVMSAVIAAVFWTQTGAATAPNLGFTPEVRGQMVVWLLVVPLVLGLLFAAAVGALLLPGPRHRLRWRLPASRDASLARFASSMAALLAGMPVSVPGVTI
ncbi:MAG TPA: type II secretion system F family protein, partial [Verrucomicrobiota bacterium]|nr:type II secretion system F family protein [Verrucomicrobiota bacterium]